MRHSRIPAVFALAFAFCVAAAPFRAIAQSEPSAETMQAARDLMAVMSASTVRQMVTGITNQVWPSIEREVRSKRPDVDQATLLELRTEYENIQLRYTAGILADAPKIYARYFTAAELREILAHHKTPAGQKALQLMPQVMADIVAMIMPQMQGIQAQIIAAFQEVLRKKGINL
jgi:hypothetical protein